MNKALHPGVATLGSAAPALPTELLSEINSRVPIREQLVQLGVSETSITELEAHPGSKNYALLVARLKLYSQWRNYLADAYQRQKTPAVNMLDLAQLLLISDVKLSFDSLEHYFDAGDEAYKLNLSKVYKTAFLVAFIGDTELLQSILEIEHHSYSETLNYTYQANNLLQNLAVLSGNPQTVKSLASRGNITFVKNRDHILLGLQIYIGITFAILAGAGFMILLPVLILIPIAGIIFGEIAAGLLVAIPLLVLAVAIVAELYDKHFYRPNAAESLKHASLSGNTALMQEYHAQIKTVPNEVLRFAVLSGDVATVNLALSWGLDVRQCDEHNRDLSFYATQSSNPEVMSLIREKLATTAVLPSASQALRAPAVASSNGFSFWRATASAGAGVSSLAASELADETAALLAAPH